jgi:hypothetical protein
VEGKYEKIHSSVWHAHTPVEFKALLVASSRMSLPGEPLVLGENNLECPPLLAQPAWTSQSELADLLDSSQASCICRHIVKLLIGKGYSFVEKIPEKECKIDFFDIIIKMTKYGYCFKKCFKIYLISI